MIAKQTRDKDIPARGGFISFSGLGEVKQRRYHFVSVGSRMLVWFMLIISVSVLTV